MSARGKLGTLAVAALALGAGLAGCKDKESLVVVTLTAAAAAGDTALTSARISVGTYTETFPLKAGVGVPYDGVSFGLYVPSGLTGLQSISVVASQAQASCAVGTGQVNIKTAGQTYGPVAVQLGASSSSCPSGGTGGGTGSGGSGTGGATGSGGSGTGGATGSGGSGTGGATGSGGSGMGGHGTGGSSGTGGGFTCFEYDHGDPGICAAGSCDSAADWGIYGAAFSPVTPGLAVTSGTDGRTKVWTVSNGSMVAEGHVLTGGTGIGAIGFSPDGTLLAVGQQGGIQIVSVATWTVVRTLIVADRVYGVAFSPDGTQVVSLDLDETSSAVPPPGHLYVHSVSNVAALYSVAVTGAWALGVSPVASPNGLPVTVTTSIGTALVYTLTSGGFSSPATLNVTSDQSTVETAQFSPNGTLLAAGGDDGVLRFWSVPPIGAAQAGTIDVSTVTNGTSDLVNVVAFSPDGSQLALGAGFYGSVTTFATASRAQIGGEQDTSADYDVYALGYSNDGKYIIGGESDCGCVFLCH